MPRRKEPCFVGCFTSRSKFSLLKIHPARCFPGGSLEKQHVVQRDTREVLQAGSRLDGIVDFVLLFVDEDVNRMVMLHEMLLRRSDDYWLFRALCARNTNLRLSSSEISYAVVNSSREQTERGSN